MEVTLLKQRAWSVVRFVMPGIETAVDGRVPFEYVTVEDTMCTNLSNHHTAIYVTVEMGKVLVFNLCLSVRLFVCFILFVCLFIFVCLFVHFGVIVFVTAAVALQVFMIIVSFISIQVQSQQQPLYLYLKV